MTTSNADTKNSPNLIPDIRNWPFAKEIQEYVTPGFPVRHSGSFAVMMGFSDPELLLDSAYGMVQRYLLAAGYSESESETADYRIETHYVPTEFFESWTLERCGSGMEKVR